MNPGIWKFIYDHLEADERVILITVLDVKGSSPGRVGFKMAVAEMGDISGSIGGGVMEYNMVERARKMILEKCQSITVKREVHISEEVEDRSGLICSGEQTQTLIPLAHSDIFVLSEIRECIDKGETGTIMLSPEGLSFRPKEKTDGDIVVTFSESDKWEYCEQTGYKDTLYIFGAGHISLPLSQIMSLLDFRIVVYDDRENLSTFILNSHAHHKEIIDFKNAGEHVPDGMNNYAAIMSFGHRADKLILSQLLHKKIKYLGMIGSRNKVRAIYDSLRIEGFTEEDFLRVDSPIGLSINSQTPAEIAVSIAAKIIQTRNSK